MREEASFRMLFEKFRASKLEIDDPIPPKKINVLIHYGKGEAPVESTVEEHYHQIFISAEILH